ncbi:hypothetical protein [Caulobacter phage KcrB]|nr:hypothetical protein RW_GP021 [Caulobacter phage RW]WCA46325.1 hypothetical protein [Caulobacter phage KcrB]WCD56260.1 hypothetical protein [Caulobacter phage RLK]WNV48052.1 hypothetical protein GB2A_gp020 [Caulobacter phage GB2A]
MAKFKAGDRVRRIARPYRFVPLGYETEVVEHHGGALWYRDTDGSLLSFYAEHWELVEPQPFDPAKLRKGDKVLVVLEVTRDGLDKDGGVTTRSRMYFKPDELVGYAPGYTPQSDEPLTVGDRVACPELFSGAATVRYIANDEAAVEADAGGLYTVALSDLGRA